jgi:hypothetical protein
MSVTSQRSQSALDRRAAIESARSERESRFRQEELYRMIEEEKDLEVADQESVAEGNPDKLTADALLIQEPISLVHLQRRIAELDRTREALVRAQSGLLDSNAEGDHRRHSIADQLHSDSPPDHNTALKHLPLVSTVPTATLSLKVKPMVPKPWKGSFLAAERDSAIKSMKGYFAAIGLDLTARIDEDFSPQAFHIVRSLFSNESGPGGVSPQAWYDARNERSPWNTANEVLEAMELYWVDDTAKERAVAALRACRQGSLTARQFGTKVEQLASACKGRRFTEEDLTEIFNNGLTPSTKEYLDLQVKQGRRLMRREFGFLEQVAIAAEKDHVLKDYKLETRTKVSIHTSVPVLAETSSTNKTLRDSQWETKAQHWQATHPIDQKSAWHQPVGTKKPEPGLVCFNCCKAREHFSPQCSFPRGDPTKRSFVVASLKLSGHSAPVTSSLSTSSPFTTSTASLSSIPTNTAEGKGSDE